MPEAGELFNYIFPGALAKRSIGGFHEWLEGGVFTLLLRCGTGGWHWVQWITKSATTAAKL